MREIYLDQAVVRRRFLVFRSIAVTSMWASPHNFHIWPVPTEPSGSTSLNPYQILQCLKISFSESNLPDPARLNHEELRLSFSPPSSPGVFPQHSSIILWPPRIKVKDQSLKHNLENRISGDLGQQPGRIPREPWWHILLKKYDRLKYQQYDQQYNQLTDYIRGLFNPRQPSRPSPGIQVIAKAEKRDGDTVYQVVARDFLNSRGSVVSRSRAHIKARPAPKWTPIYSWNW